MKIDWGLVKTDIKDFVKFCCHLFLQTLGFGVVLMMGFIIPAILYSKNYILWLWLWLIILERRIQYETIKTMSLSKRRKERKL